MKHYEMLPKVWVRAYESLDWLEAYLLQEIKSEDGYQYRAILKSNRLDLTFKHMTPEDPYAKKTRKMHPFEAKVWCDENKAQMVDRWSVGELRMGVTIDRHIEQRYILNSKIKELKGQVTWDDCSEFPEVEDA